MQVVHHAESGIQMWSLPGVVPQRIMISRERPAVAIAHDLNPLSDRAP